MQDGTRSMAAVVTIRESALLRDARRVDRGFSARRRRVLPLKAPSPHAGSAEGISIELHGPLLRDASTAARRTSSVCCEWQKDEGPKTSTRRDSIAGTATIRRTSLARACRSLGVLHGVDSLQGHSARCPTRERLVQPSGSALAPSTARQRDSGLDDRDPRRAALRPNGRLVLVVPSSQYRLHRLAKLARRDPNTPDDGAVELGTPSYSRRRLRTLLWRSGVRPDRVRGRDYSPAGVGGPLRQTVSGIMGVAPRHREVWLALASRDAGA